MLLGSQILKRFVPTGNIGKLIFFSKFIFSVRKIFLWKKPHCAEKRIFSSTNAFSGRNQVKVKRVTVYPMQLTEDFGTWFALYAIIVKQTNCFLVSAISR